MQTTSYETGATSHSANNLILSVENDGCYYKAIQANAFRILAGNNLMRTFREIVTEEANKQRVEFGSKFKPQEIAEAACIIQQNALRSSLEDIRNSYDDSRNVFVIIRRWFDKANGNSYWAAKVSVPVEDALYKQIAIPFQYGYDNHPFSQVINELSNIGIIQKDRTKGYWDYNIEFEDQGYMLKKQLWNKGFNGICKETGKVFVLV